MTPHTQANPVNEEVVKATRELLERLSDQLARRVYSPRIKLLDIKQVREVTGVSQSMIYQLVKEDRFPPPVRIGGQNRWRESSLIAWLDRQEEAA